MIILGRIEFFVIFFIIEYEILDIHERSHEAELGSFLTLLHIIS